MTSFLAEPPVVTIVVLLFSLGVSFASSLINMRLMPKEHRQKVRELQKKVSSLTKEQRENMKEAKATGDKKLLKKAEKQQRQLLQLQSQQLSMTSKQMRVMPFTMAFFFVVWLLLTGRFLYWPLFDSPFMGPSPVAYLPWFGGVFPLQLTYWYLICSLTFGTFFQRIFGLTGAVD